MLGFVKSSTSNFNTTRWLQYLYCTLVRPQLECASCVWSNHNDSHKERLELVQYKFLRYVAFRLNTNEIFFTNLLYFLYLLLLKVRRLQRKLKTFFFIALFCWRESDFVFQRDLPDLHFYLLYLIIVRITVLTRSLVGQHLSVLFCRFNFV